MDGKRLALLIGNGSFGRESGFAALRCPPADVTGMAEMLKDDSHGPFEVSAFVDASQQEIQKALHETLARKAESNDTILLYYSGHGSPDVDGSLFLAARDSDKENLPATAVSIDYVVNRMRASRSQKIILILDCCFSGGIERAFTRGEVAEQVRAALPKLNGSGMYVLTASTDTQLAEERPGDTNGLLTKHILSGIREGKADLDDDGMVTMHELMVYVQDAVRREGMQEPLGFALRSGGGDLLFARTGRSDLTEKSRSVEEMLWQTRTRFRLPSKVVQHVWGLVSVDAVRSDREHAKFCIDRLYRHMRAEGEFVDEVYALYDEAAPGVPPIALPPTVPSVHDQPSPTVVPPSKAESEAPAISNVAWNHSVADGGDTTDATKLLFHNFTPDVELLPLWRRLSSSVRRRSFLVGTVLCVAVLSIGVAVYVIDSAMVPSKVPKKLALNPALDVPSPNQPSPTRIPGSAVEENILVKVRPVYPPIAKAAHVEGIVVIHAIISRTGDIKELNALSGPEMLKAAAVDAVSRWRYKPFLLNGLPIEAETTITVNFNLSGG